MNPNSQRPFRCRCGRETNRPEIIRGMLLCGSCAFDELYGAYQPNKEQAPVRPPFSVRRVE